ncbi:MAG: hypothetical protein LUM44_06605 [Pyrinomonadaceae bacterium]|nr:hypothetical protein [Pyrinomonadaceae bacterium]
MNTFKYLFLLILCIGSIGSFNNIFAQDKTDQVLVAGKKPLKQSDVDTLIEFYEWAFETRFTETQRSKFQSLVTADFRRNQAKERASIDEVLKTFAQISAAPEDVQQKGREIFNNEYIEELRRTPNDEDSKFMLEIYENGRKNENPKVTENSPGNSSNRPQIGGSDTKKIVGKWKHSGGSGGARDHTGKTLYNNGDDVIFEFFADGTMTFLNEKNTLSITQCRISETTKIPGTYTISGDQLTMNFGTGNSVGTSTCDKKGNFKKNLAPASLTKQFSVKNLESLFRPDAPLVLVFDGNEEVYYERVR